MHAKNVFDYHPLALALFLSSLSLTAAHAADSSDTAAPGGTLVLQETKLTDSDFPTLDIANAGYHAVFAGQKTYNGVAILSRLPAADLIIDLPGISDPQRRVLGAIKSAIRKSGRK